MNTCVSKMFRIFTLNFQFLPLPSLLQRTIAESLCVTGLLDLVFGERISGSIFIEKGESDVTTVFVFRWSPISDNFQCVLFVKWSQINTSGKKKQRIFKILLYKYKNVKEMQNYERIRVFKHIFWKKNFLNKATVCITHVMHESTEGSN